MTEYISFITPPARAWRPNDSPALQAEDGSYYKEVPDVDRPVFLYVKDVWCGTLDKEFDALGLYISIDEIQTLVDSIYQVHKIVAQGVSATDLLDNYRQGHDGV